MSWGDALAPIRLFIDAHIVSKLRTGVNDVVVARINCHDHAIASIERLPRILRGIGGFAIPYPIVLHAAIDIVRGGIVYHDRIELGNWHLGIEVIPTRPSAIASVQAAVVTEQDVLGILRVDPHGLVIRVRSADGVGTGKVLSSVTRHQKRYTQYKNFIFIGPLLYVRNRSYKISSGNIRPYRIVGESICCSCYLYQFPVFKTYK